MTGILFLRYFADLAFYYSFASVFVTRTGGHSVWLMLLICSVIGTISARLKQKHQKIGIGMLVMLIAGFAAPSLRLPEIILYLPAMLYTGMVTVRGAERVSQESAVASFSVFWKAYALFAAAVLLMAGASALTDCSIFVALTCAVSYIALIRTLRHDYETRTQPQIQIMNTVSAAAVLAFAGLLSTKPFINAASSILKFIWQDIFAPVLVAISLLFVYCFSWVFKIIEWLLSLIRGEDTELELNNNLTENLEEQLQLNGSGTASAIILIVIRIILIATAIALLILFFRWLSGHVRKDENHIARFTDSVSEKPAEEASKRSSVFSVEGRIRNYYRKYMLLCQSCGYTPELTDTTLDINSKTTYLRKDESASQEFREIYIRARYEGNATREDVLRAKSLLTSLREEMYMSNKKLPD